MFIQYQHHGTQVWVREDLKGKHREHCLCWSPCALFKPDDPDNCPIAQANYEFCVKHNVTLPVWECPVFEEKNSRSGYLHSRPHAERQEGGQG